MTTKLLANRARETTTTTGTSTYSLGGATGKYITLVLALSRAQGGGGPWANVPYVVYDDTDYEIGLGTVTNSSPDTLSRDSILESSNAGAAVSWGAGTRTVIISPASYTFGTAAFEDDGRYLIVANLLSDLTDIVTARDNLEATSKAVFNCWSSSITIAGATQYISNTGGHSAIEAGVDAAWPIPVKCDNLRIVTEDLGGPGAGESWTFTLRKNGGDTRLTPTISNTN